MSTRQEQTIHETAPACRAEHGPSRCLSGVSLGEMHGTEHIRADVRQTEALSALAPHALKPPA
jgi:hypothetical protein